MGNSASKRGNNKRPRKKSVDPEAGEEEEEYEIEYVYEEEDTPTSSVVLTQQTNIRSMPVLSARQKNELKYENIKKPLKKAQVFAKHYLSTLHRCYGNANFIEDRTWLLRLGEEHLDEPSFGVQGPPIVVRTQRGFQDQNFANISNSSNAQRKNSIGGEVLRGAQDGIPERYSNKYQSPFPSREQVIIQKETSTPPLPLIAEVDKQREREGSGNIDRELDRGWEKDTERATLTNDTRLKMDWNKNTLDEGDFVKTAFERSEADSDAWADEVRKRAKELDQNRELDCPECEGSRSRCEDPHTSRLSYQGQVKERNKQIEENKLQMYENYLQNALAEKPGKLQSLLIQKYFSGADKKPSQMLPNRISNALRDMGLDPILPAGPRSGHQGSLLVERLEDEINQRCINPEPAVLTETGVRMIDVKGKQVPLKLIRFVKDTDITKGSSAYRESHPTDNPNIVYLADKFQLNNYIQRKEGTAKAKKKKDYTKVKTETLWPKGVKINRPNYAREFELNELSRRSRERDSLQHSLNLAAPKHHPRNLNYQREDEIGSLRVTPSSPVWGTPSSRQEGGGLEDIRRNLTKINRVSPSRAANLHTQTIRSSDPKSLRALVQTALRSKGTSN